MGGNPHEPFFKALSDIAKARDADPEVARRKADRVKALELKYGPLNVASRVTESEIRLEAATSQFARWGEYLTPQNERVRYVQGLEGWSSHSCVPDAIRLAIEADNPLPATLGSAMDEIRFWDDLADIREIHLGDGAAEHTPSVKARIQLLEDQLNTKPARDWNDLKARLSWVHFNFQLEWQNSREWELLIVERMKADLDSLAPA